MVAFWSAWPYVLISAVMSACAVLWKLAAQLLHGMITEQCCHMLAREALTGFRHAIARSPKRGSRHARLLHTQPADEPAVRGVGLLVRHAYCADDRQR